MKVIHRCLAEIKWFLSESTASRCVDGASKHVAGGMAHTGIRECLRQHQVPPSRRYCPGERAHHLTLVLAQQLAHCRPGICCQQTPFNRAAKRHVLMNGVGRGLLEVCMQPAGLKLLRPWCWRLANEHYQMLCQ
jgi:hypothetical protein